MFSIFVKGSIRKQLSPILLISCRVDFWKSVISYLIENERSFQPAKPYAKPSSQCSFVLTAFVTNIAFITKMCSPHMLLLSIIFPSMKLQLLDRKLSYAFYKRWTEQQLFTLESSVASNQLLLPSKKRSWDLQCTLSRISVRILVKLHCFLSCWKMCKTNIGGKKA